MRSLPQIDLTRTFFRRTAQPIRPRGQSLPKGAFIDISPSEIEQRYQARLAELKWLRNNPSLGAK